MTYIITTITNKSILMASDSRLNYHIGEISSAGDKFQVILATADCIRKTFILAPFNIGIQFIGIGYFEENGQKYPIAYFIPRFIDDLLATDSLEIKFKKIYDNLKKLTNKGDTGQYINGVITGYENNLPYISTFNTFIDDFEVKSYEMGAYMESEFCNEARPVDRDHAINYINNKISKVNVVRPYDVGGPIEILELMPDGSFSWLQENDNIFNGTLSELLIKLEREPDTIAGIYLDPPVRQKIVTQ